ncbi:GNAT family N-acetyltransferase [soil metagenome]
MPAPTLLNGAVNTVELRALTGADWPEVERIFREGIATGHATFESDPPTWDRFDAGKVAHSRLVAVDDAGAVLGWVAASPVSSRAVYAGVVEHSVYVSDVARGRGVGGALLGAFLASAEARGVWTVQSNIFPENSASLALHARFGFREIGRRERIARMTYGPMAGVWRDTILLERRAPEK